MKSTLLCLLIATTATAAIVAPTSPRPLIRAPARRLAAPALAAAAEDDMPASERPGNYVDPYSMALGVSVSAVLCSELVPQTSALAVSGAHLWVGRVAACSGLPLLVACFLALKSAAVVGPTRLRSATYQRLNLAVALTSILAVAVPPRPLLACVIGRVGSALLCLEVWSQSSGVPQSDPVLQMVGEVGAIAKGAAGSAAACVGLLLPWGGAAEAGNAGARPGAARGYALAAVALGGLAAWSLAAPAAAAAAYWPAAGPALGAARGASTAGLAAACAATLADAASRGRLGASTFRLLNLGLLAATAAHLASQAAGWLVLSGLKDTVGAAALWLAPPGPPGALVAAGLQLALVGLCAWVRRTEVA